VQCRPTRKGRTMNILNKSSVLFLFLLLLSVSSGCASSAEVVSTPNRNIYVHYNVMLSSACFGIAAGDELQMRIPADYVLYEIKFNDGRSAVVYFGHHAKIVDPVLRTNFEDCVATAETCSFIRENGAVLEAMYLGDREKSGVHLLLSGINPGNLGRAREFVDNFRPCRRVGLNLICRDERAFEQNPGQSAINRIP